MELYQIIESNQTSYLRYLTLIKNYSPATIKAYEKDLFLLKTYCASKRQPFFLNDEKREESRLMLQDFLKFLYEKKYHSNSVYRIRCSLESFFKYLTHQKVITYSPLEGIYALKRKKTLPVFVSQKGISRISKEMAKSDSSNSSSLPNYLTLRDQLIWEFLYGLGLRISELEQLDLTRIDLEHSNVIVTGKGGKTHLLPLTLKLKRLLSNYLPQRNFFLNRWKKKHNTLLLNRLGAPLSVRGIRYAFMSRLKKNRVGAGIYPHMLRHSIATHLLENGAGLNRVKQLLRHRSVATTQIYTHLSKETLKEKYHRFHPMGDDSGDHPNS